MTLEPRVRYASETDSGVIARLRREWAMEAGSSVSPVAGLQDDAAAFEREMAAWMAAELGHRHFWLAEVRVTRSG